MKTAEEENPLKRRRKHRKKFREKQCMLPEEMVIEILAKLPLKTLVRLSYVCKTWHSWIIQNPYFGKKHLNDGNNKECDPILVLAKRDTKNTNTFIAHNFHNGSLPVASRVSEFRDSNSRGLASCDGILCSAESMGGPIYLFNPITRQDPLRIPRNDDMGGDERMCGLGFGFNASSKDYKVVILMRSWKLDDERSSVYTYKLSTKNWTKLDVNLKLQHRCIEIPGGVFVKGFYYWPIFHGGKPKIFKFELENDAFGEIEGPTEGRCGKTPECLSVVDDSLAICSFTGDRNHRGVWVMGKQETWMKMYFVTLSAKITKVATF